MLGSIGDRSVTEEQTLGFTATATDSDLPANDLTFTLGAGAPAGASISAAGVFSWTPTIAQRGTHDIEIVVVDNGTPQKQDSETITVTVSEFVPPPIIADVVLEIGTIEYGDDTLYASSSK